MSDRGNNRSYSLTNLEDAVEDAITSDCTPEEIYDTIRTTLRRNLTYHRICVRTANEVLRLVHGTEHKDKVINLHEKELDQSLRDNYLPTDSSQWPDYTELPDDDWRRIEDPHWSGTGYGTTLDKGKEMSYQEMIDAGYEMTGEGIWWPKDKEKEKEKEDLFASMDGVTEETPDYNNPYVCAKIDELAGDNRN